MRLHDNRPFPPHLTLTSKLLDNRIQQVHCFVGVLATVILHLVRYFLSLVIYQIHSICVKVHPHYNRHVDQHYHATKVLIDIVSTYELTRHLIKLLVHRKLIVTPEN